MVKLKGILDRSLNQKQMLTLVMVLAITADKSDLKHADSLKKQAVELADKMPTWDIEECKASSSILVFEEGFPNISKAVLDQHLDKLEENYG